jgi:hypothetical protein
MSSCSTDRVAFTANGNICSVGCIWISWPMFLLLCILKRIVEILLIFLILLLKKKKKKNKKKKKSKSGVPNPWPARLCYATSGHICKLFILSFRSMSYYRDADTFLARPSAKIRWKSFRLEFLVSRQHPPHWLSSKGPNYQRGVLLISAGLVAVACFLPGRAKDLSAPRYRPIASPKARSVQNEIWCFLFQFPYLLFCLRSSSSFRSFLPHFYPSNYLAFSNVC